jgi:very-short-patch-repair endonuclease
MEIIIGLIAIFILSMLVQYLKQQTISTNKNSSKSTNKNYNYSKSYKSVNSLLTKAELNFYDTLEPICHELNLTLFAKVRMWDLVTVIAKNNITAYQNKVKSKHIDFVICDTRTLKPIICIELDDKSHNRADRKERDRFIDEVLSSSGYTVLHVPCASSYNKDIIRNKIKNAIPKRKAS